MNFGNRFNNTSSLFGSDFNNSPSSLFRTVSSSGSEQPSSSSSNMFFERPLGTPWSQGSGIPRDGFPMMRDPMAKEIPIQVVRETNSKKESNLDGHQENQAESSPNMDNQGSSQQPNNGPNVHEAKVQPRVHHIPIMVEPRDDGPRSRSGSTGSGHGHLQREKSPTPTSNTSQTYNQNQPHHPHHPNQYPHHHHGQPDYHSQFSNGISAPFRVGSPNLGGGFYPSPKGSPSLVRKEKEIPIKVQRNVSPVRNQQQQSPSQTNIAFGEPAKAKSMSPSPGMTQSKRNVPPQSTGGPSYGHSGSHVTQIPVYHERPSQHSTPPPQQPKPSKPDALEVIKAVDDEVTKFEAEVNEYTGEYQDKKYRYLDEMLTRCMLKLDDIEVNGRDDIRKARKETLNRIQQILNTLESKAQKEVKDDAASAAATTTEQSSGEPAEESIETEETKLVNNDESPISNEEESAMVDEIQSEALAEGETKEQMEVEQPSEEKREQSMEPMEDGSGDSPNVEDTMEAEPVLADDGKPAEAEMADGDADSQVEEMAEEPLVEKSTTEPVVEEPEELPEIQPEEPVAVDVNTENGETIVTTVEVEEDNSGSPGVICKIIEETDEGPLETIDMTKINSGDNLNNCTRL